MLKIKIILCLDSNYYYVTIVELGYIYTPDKRKQPVQVS